MDILLAIRAIRVRMPHCELKWEIPNRKCDAIHCWIQPVMKTTYDALCRAEHYHDYGCHVWAGGAAAIGVLSGGLETTTIVATAEALAAHMIYRSAMHVTWVMDALYPPGAAARKPLWGRMRSLAALARNTHLICWDGAPWEAYAGPCTDMYLYEIAVAAIGYVICGINPEHGGGRCGTETDYFGGPLDTRFLHDIAYAATKLSREQANEIVKTILAKYEDRIIAKNPPIGKRFQECNDLNTLKPTKEYLDLYNKVKKELEDLGLKFDASL